jgi:hypothetical protein
LSNTEDAVRGLEQIFLQDYPTFLRTIELENTDGVMMENLRQIEWEEIDEETTIQMPGVVLIGEDETDEVLRDQLYNCRITAIFFVADTNKRNVTKKMYRYGKALRRMLKKTNNRSLRGSAISAKVGAIRWLPTGRGVGATAGLFARGFEADLVVRLQKEGD